MISGLFFGFAFGMGGIGAAILGRIADATSILFVYKICAYLPAIGLLAGFLPKIGAKLADWISFLSREPPPRESNRRSLHCASLRSG